jgi:hypothetical protein
MHANFAFGGFFSLAGGDAALCARERPKRDHPCQWNTAAATPNDCEEEKEKLGDRQQQAR